MRIETSPYSAAVTAGAGVALVCMAIFIAHQVTIRTGRLAYGLLTAGFVLSLVLYAGL